MKKLYGILLLALALALCLSISVFATDAVPENYEESDSAYTVYTDAQYQEVILGVYEGTLANKTIKFGCSISVTLDLYMEKPCDITLDLNGFTYTNNYRPVKAGDFDLRHKDAIIRIKNGNMECSFCVFIFQTNSNSEYSSCDNMGQVYLENVNIRSQEEIVYHYGGCGGVLNFKNCNLDVIQQQYSVNWSGNCGTEAGMLYQIDGGTYDGLNVHCALPGSYVKNCTVYNRELFIDSWHAHGENGTDSSVTLTNVTADVQLRLNDPRIDPVLYDCTISEFVLGGNQLIVSYTSPTCEKAGTKTSYIGSAMGTVDEQYPIDNPALGHSADLNKIIDLVYENGFINNGTYVCECSRCDAQNIKENEPSAPALISFTGIATQQNGTGICVGYAVDFAAIDEYKEFGKTFEYGVVAYIPLESETNVEPINNDLSGGAYTISASLTDSESPSFEFKIMGFDASHYELDLVMSAYVYDGTEVDYINLAISNTVIVSQNDYASTLTMKQVSEYKNK